MGKYEINNPAVVLKFNALILLVALLMGCAPMIYPPGDRVFPGQLLEDRFIAADGVRLPLKKWLPETIKPQALLIALHGFNDYSNFFQLPGEYFRQQGIACYAYDQRGFGGSPNRGLWPGIEAYTQDLGLFIQLLATKYPGVPIYLLGASMGGAIGIVTMAQQNSIFVDGMILAAPAVWGRATMPWYQNGLLWILSHTTPWMTLSGEGLEVTPSDNRAMLEALGKDPLVIKKTRVDAIHGLVDLMDAALDNAGSIRSNTLFLYGENDEIIPKESTAVFLRDLNNVSLENIKIAFYKDGYHMLLRDLQAPILWKDIVTWISHKAASLPSGADKRAEQILKKAGGEVAVDDFVELSGR